MAILGAGALFSVPCASQAVLMPLKPPLWTQRVSKSTNPLLVICDTRRERLPNIRAGLPPASGGAAAGLKHSCGVIDGQGVRTVLTAQGKREFSRFLLIKPERNFTSEWTGGGNYLFNAVILPGGNSRVRWTSRISLWEESQNLSGWKVSSAPTCIPDTITSHQKPNRVLWSLLLCHVVKRTQNTHGCSKNHSPSTTCSFSAQFGLNIHYAGGREVTQVEEKGEKRKKKLVAIEFVLERLSITIIREIMTCCLSYEMPITVMEQELFQSYLHELIFHGNFIGINIHIYTSYLHPLTLP